MIHDVMRDHSTTNQILCTTGICDPCDLSGCITLLGRHVSWQGFQVGSDAVATAYITVASEVALARFPMQLPNDSGLQHLGCKYCIILSFLDRFFTRTIVR